MRGRIPVWAVHVRRRMTCRCRNSGRKHAVAVVCTRIEQNPYDAVSAALVINETARSEFTDAEKSEGAG